MRYPVLWLLLFLATSMSVLWIVINWYLNLNVSDRTTQDARESLPRAPSRNPAEPMQLNVLVYNVFLPVPPPLRFYGQNERAARIVEGLETLPVKPDVIVFNELVPPAYVSAVTRALNQHHPSLRPFPYRNQTGLSGWGPVNGGVWLFSRYPILDEARTIYGTCQHGDCLMNKGAIRVTLSLPHGRRVHVVGTHLQAWSGASEDRKRVDQLHHLHRWLDEQHLPRHEPVLLAGDLNWDRPVLERYLEDHNSPWRLPEAAGDSPRHSWDSQTNQLVGLDSMVSYQCTDEYFRTLKCACCQPEWLDHVLWHRDHLAPVRAELRVCPVKVPPFEMRFSLKVKHETRDVSDHYPVLGTFTWPGQKE